MRLSLTEYILAGLLIVATIFGGWNWYRKNVYYDRLQTRSAARTQEAQDITGELQRAANLTAKAMKERSDVREADLNAQLQYLRDHPVERTVYRMRDRWLTGTCPAGSPGTDGDVPPAAGGLPLELEQYFVRAAVAADGVVDERNQCVEMYNRAQAAAVEWNRKHGR